MLKRPSLENLETTQTTYIFKIFRFLMLSFLRKTSCNLFWSLNLSKNWMQLWLTFPNLFIQMISFLLTRFLPWWSCNHLYEIYRDELRTYSFDTSIVPKLPQKQNEEVKSDSRKESLPFIIDSWLLLNKVSICSWHKLPFPNLWSQLLKIPCKFLSEKLICTNTL